MSKPLVVHCMKAPFDVYVGRGQSPQDGTWGIYGNPFTSKKSNIALVQMHSAQESVRNYAAWLRGLAWQDLEQRRRQRILDSIANGDLVGMTLGCWCGQWDQLPAEDPQYDRCHALTLARFSQWVYGE